MFYDDTQTTWQIDYIELYDFQEKLLLIAWLDRFGTCRAVMNRGFFNMDNPSVHDVMIPIAVGNDSLNHRRMLALAGMLAA